MLPIILKYCPPPNGEEKEMPSLYLLQLSGQKGLNSCLEPLALIGLPYAGQVWGHQAELHWDSKQMKIIPQTPTGCWPQRTSAK